LPRNEEAIYTNRRLLEIKIWLRNYKKYILAGVKSAVGIQSTDTGKNFATGIIYSG
jgi:hypothetical protein